MSADQENWHSRNARMVRRVGLAAVGLLVAAGIAWALRASSLPPADFTFSNLGEIKTVDPALVTGASEGRVVEALFEGLTTWNPRDLSPQPGVASKWEVSADGLTYTFYLRPEARWSDGTPVTAEDFVWSFQRFLHPETAAEYAAELWYIVGAKKYTAGQVELGDPVEVELTTKPTDALPFSRGDIVRGQLIGVSDRSGTKFLPQWNDRLSTEADSIPVDSLAEPVYWVLVDGQVRRFQKRAVAPGAIDYRWLLYDFQAVGIRAIDRHRLQIRLRHPVPYFLSLMGFYPFSPVPRHCVERYGYPEWTKPGKIVTNGPYVLQFRRIRDRIRLVKNPYYWNKDNVRLEVVDILAVESYTTNLNLYFTGQVDWIPTVPAEVVAELRQSRPQELRVHPLLGTYYYLLNTARPPLDDVRVRRALALAINREEIVEKVTRGGQRPLCSMVPEVISHYVPGYTPQRGPGFDVDEARRLLAEAGYGKDRPFPPIDILYNTSEAHQAIAELIQAQWQRHLGIRVGLRNQEWAAYLSSRRQGEFYVARAGWIGDYVDPITFLDMFSGESPLNNTRWNHPEYNRLLEEARQEGNPERRLKILEKAERILMDELPAIPLYQYVSQNLVRPYVQGFYDNPKDFHPLKYMWVDKELKRKIFRGGRP
ncbi:MAG: peptide ABC transporter substrate-binding protein [Thermoguttaceae bacterium]|nr:peptide ABC transporter substrate-binding protein [Thermoguttaceae bacterium]MDW8080077.1 peptide ABC transporter substrate-binding protein [Thermoguttaceae bacterium]